MADQPPDVQILGDAVTGNPKSEVPKTPSQPKPSRAQLALGLVLKLEEGDSKRIWRFRDRHGTAYMRACLESGGWQTFEIDSGKCREHLARYFANQHRFLLNPKEHADLQSHLADLTPPDRVEAIFNRVARDEKKIVLDLGDALGQVVVIQNGEWEVTKDHEVNFVRPPGMGSLPSPNRNGSNRGLWKLFPHVSEHGQILCDGWLVSGLMRPPRCFVLELIGEQASAKSTLGTTLVQMYDPKGECRQALPRNERDLRVVAEDSYAVHFDNISDLPDYMSDAMCRLVDGTAFSVRKHYTNKARVVFDGTRHVILNGITPIVTRPDLKSRTLTVEIPPIPEKDRRGDDYIEKRVREIAPDVLGALLNATALSQQQYANTECKTSLRNTSAAKWVSAGETALGHSEGDFVSAAHAAKREAELDILADLDWYDAFCKVIDEKGGEFDGTASEFLGAMRFKGAGSDLVRPLGFPANAAVLGKEIKRLKPVLTKAGYVVVIGRISKGSRRIIISTSPSG